MVALNRSDSHSAGAWTDGVQYVALYDDECGLCRWAANWIKAHDPASLILCLPLQTPGLLERFSINRAEAVRQIQVISRAGEVQAGADGALWVIAQLPGYGWLALFNWLTPFRIIARLVYRQIATRWAGDGCQNGRCHP